MKRSNPDQHSSDSHSTKTFDQDAAPPSSKRLLSAASEPISFTRITCLEELDKRALQLQNKKLCESVADHRAAMTELRQRIEHLEHRQAKDDTLLCVVNRYWNQLDEDSLILLQRFDSDVNEEFSTSTESFLKQLASWDKEEVPDKLKERVHFSKRVIARLLSAYEKMIVHRSRLRCAIDSKSSDEHTVDSSGVVQSMSSLSPKSSGVSEFGDKNTELSEPDNLRSQELSIMNKENQRLQSLCTDLHAKHRQSSLRLRELQDLAQFHQDAAAEWQAKYEDLDYKLSQEMKQVTRLDHRLYDAQEQCKQLKAELTALKGTESPANDDSLNTDGSGSVAKNKYNDLVCELEEYRELANNRISELERIQRHLEDKVAECALLNMQLRDVPESVIFESPQYISLKTQFNLLYNEAVQLRAQLEEARTTIQNNRHNHVKQIEEMESNETAIQQQMRSEMLLIEGQYSHLRHKFETMELDFKQALTHNEQAGPINSEMRSLISTLQTQNKQLKAEVVRYHHKCEELVQEKELIRSDLTYTEEELTLVRTALSQATESIVEKSRQSDLYTEKATISDGLLNPTLPESVDSEAAMKAVKSEDGGTTVTSGVTTISSQSLTNSNIGNRSGGEKTATKAEPGNAADNRATSSTSSEIIRDLREQLKRSQESQKEMSVLLNMYKVIPKDQRDKAALLQSEAKLRSELCEAKQEVEKYQSTVQDLQQQLRSQRKAMLTSPYEGSLKTSPSDRLSSSAAAAGSAGSTNSPFHSIIKESPDDKNVNAMPLSSCGGSGVQLGQINNRVKATAQDWQLVDFQIEVQLIKRKFQSLEEQSKVYQQRLSTAKQQEDVLLKEMEITVQAFEDVQEQNVRLVKTLREKDDAHLKLMTERLKTAHLARLLKEDKQLLEEQIRLMQAKIEALNRTVRKQEDKERLLLTNLSTLEKEAITRQKLQETYKRKGQESQQISEDLRVTVQKYQSQLKDTQISVQEKASSFERISFRHQRLQEELTTVRRKYERLRRIEQSHNADEFLLAEIQDYKEQLTCSTCKVNRKDAILTKCFHVFCLNCLKIRYETRNRKCPKCNATFGANDYHRIYLT